MDKVVEVVMTEDRGKCTKLFARIVKKSVKSHLNPEKTVRCIVRTVFQSIKIAAANFKTVLQAIQKPVRLIPGGLLLSFLFIVISMPVFAQEHQSTNDIITRMKNALNLSDDQVANITQVIDRYVDASNDLQKSIE